MEHHVQKLKGLLVRMESKSPITSYDIQLVRRSVELLEKVILHKKYPDDPQYMIFLSSEEEREYWQQERREFANKPQDMSIVEESVFWNKKASNKKG